MSIRPWNHDSIKKKKYGVTHVGSYVKTEIDQFRIDLDKKLYQAEVICWEKNLLGTFVSNKLMVT